MLAQTLKNGKLLKGRDYNTNDKGQENYRNVRNQSADYWRTKIS